MTPFSTRGRAVVGALALSLGATALTAATVPSASAAGSGAPTVHVWIAKGNSVTLPSKLRPGVHRFAVRSAKGAGFQLIKPHEGYTKREAAHDVNRMFGNDLDALRRFEANTDLIGGVSSRPGERGVMWADLVRGHYWAVDTNADKVVVGDVADLYVGGRDIGGRIAGDATLRAINEVDFAKRPAAIPTSGRLVLRNDSTDNHFFGISKLRRGQTVADFKAWVDGVMQGNEEAPPVRFNVGTESGVVGPGQEMAMSYDVPRGRYVLMCWWADADMDGMPHVFMGMYRGLRVR